MKYRTFDSFRIASQYARTAAIQHSRSVQIHRQGEKFAVEDFGDLAGSESGRPESREPADKTYLLDWWERRQEEERKREEKLERLRRHEEYQHQLNRERYDRREPYLEKRKEVYRAMDKSDLLELWKKRDESDMEEDERLLLWTTLREKMGISAKTGNSARVCRSCYQVGENCTCKRSWF